MESECCSTTESARGSCMPSTAASCSITMFNVPLRESSAGQRTARTSPRAAGAAERARRARRSGTGLERGVPAVPARPLRVRLVPDRSVVPRLPGLVPGTLAPPRQEDQRRHHEDDQQRDSGEDEDGLGDGHGGQLTGTAPGSARPLPSVGVPVSPASCRLHLGRRWDQTRLVRRTPGELTRPTGRQDAMDLTRDAAEGLDDVDPLAGFRGRFVGAEDDGPDRLLYLDGNSLGRLPRETPAAVARVVEQQWG